METRIDLDGGKYTIVHENGVNFRALRYGEVWRSLTGDKLIFAMVQRIGELQESLSEAEAVFRTLGEEGPSLTATELADKYASILGAA